MRKYFNIFKAEFMSNIQYALNVALGCIGFLVFVVTFYYVWQHIYSNPDELINGYSMTQMIWYLTITEIIYTSVKASKLCKEICKDVKSGNITYNLNKPYSYIAYILFRQLGRCIFDIVIQMTIGVGVVFLLVKEMPVASVENMILILFSCILAQIISILLIVIIGLFSFKIDDATPFYWLYSKFIILIGVIFPIEFFPESIQGILVYTPIYVIAYGPAKLFVDFSVNNFVSITIAQLLYIFFTYSICLAIYNSGVKRLNVNGG